MEIKVIITIDEKVEKLAEQILAALTFRAVVKETPSEPAETPKEPKPVETPVQAKSAPKTKETVKTSEPTEDPYAFEPEIASVDLGEILAEEKLKAETTKATAAEARVAVNKARDRKVNMTTVKELITNKYGAANVSSIAEDRLAEFIKEVEAL